MIALNQNSRPGRKPLLDEAKRREICEVLAVGGTRTMAAAYVGCSLDTIARAAKRDRAFAKDLRRASAECEIRCLRNLSNAAQDPSQWCAAAWTLERLWPERYARRKHVALTAVRRGSPRGRETAALAHHLGVPPTQGGWGRTRRKSARPRPPRADGGARWRATTGSTPYNPPAPACGTERRSVLRSVGKRCGGLLRNTKSTRGNREILRQNPAFRSSAAYSVLGQRAAAPQNCLPP